GLIGAVAIATIPLAVGLDAMRQLAFAGAQSFGTPPPSIEALILLVMTVVFLGIARFTLRTFERLARQEGRLTMRWQGWSGDEALTDHVLGSPSVFDPGRARRRGPFEAWRGFATAVRLGWLMEANWTDPILFFIYSVAKPIASALILIFMLEVIAGPAGRGQRSLVG